MASFYKGIMLRYIVFLLLLFLLQFNVAQAQDVCEGGFYVGTNRTKFHERFFVYDNRWGGQVGFDAKIGNKFIQTELSLGYLNMGVKYIVNGVVGLDKNSKYQEHRYTYKSSGHYIDLPISISLGWWDMQDSGFGMTVSGGAYMSVGLAGEINVKGEYKSHDEGGHLYDSFSKKYSIKYFGDNNYQYKRFDAGWTVGGRFALGEIIRISVLYRQGFVNLSNIKNYKVTNRSLMLGLIFVVPED